MFSLLARWNELAGTPIEEPLNGSIRKTAHRGIYTKQIAAENVHESTSQQWRSNELVWRLNCSLEIVHTVSENTDRIAISLHSIK
jgi:hypothetical protein